ncbi:hypothetical protein PHLCEN_2v10081 [Hermanssonia centrifuga]|uniref:DUF6535 domain-containing protein n=1 Tax=Hermanssonia centrifuga TaxID=98765 RepID=A0A2R6NP17_9APHY|nr:hypothetical protein PHLCEN_2v10081 [Hermanssonia centrifuga]
MAESIQLQSLPYTGKPPITSASQSYTSTADKPDSTVLEGISMIPVVTDLGTQGAETLLSAETPASKKDGADIRAGDGEDFGPKKTSSSPWSVLAKTLHEMDERKVKDCKEDIDTVLVFSGLFSAVLTAFLATSYPNLQLQSADQTVSLLQQIASQQISLALSPGSINASLINSTDTPSFEPSSDWVCINALWFSSLVCSLITASFGMLVKQWLREYLAGDFVSPQVQARVQCYRRIGLHTWKVFELAAVLPSLLQLALTLFFLGLGFFTFISHRTIGGIVITLVGLWQLLFLIVTVLPMFSSSCPYKTAFLKDATHFISLRLPRFSWEETVKGRRLVLRRHRGVPPVDGEETIRGNPRYDDTVILEADRMLGDDEFLATTIWPCLDQIDGVYMVNCLEGIIKHRECIIPSSISEPDALTFQKYVGQKAREALANIAAGALNKQLLLIPRSNRGAWDFEWGWMREALQSLIRVSDPKIIRDMRGLIKNLLSYGHIQSTQVLSLLVQTDTNLSPATQEWLRSFDGPQLVLCLSHFFHDAPYTILPHPSQFLVPPPRLTLTCGARFRLVIVLLETMTKQSRWVHGGPAQQSWMDELLAWIVWMLKSCAVSSAGSHGKKFGLQLAAILGHADVTFAEKFMISLSAKPSLFISLCLLFREYDSDNLHDIINRYRVAEEHQGPSDLGPIQITEMIVYIFMCYDQGVYEVEQKLSRLWGPFLSDLAAWIEDTIGRAVVPLETSKLAGRMLSQIKAKKSLHAVVGCYLMEPLRLAAVAGRER